MLSEFHEMIVLAFHRLIRAGASNVYHTAYNVLTYTSFTLAENKIVISAFYITGFGHFIS